jgi:uncharacterized protein (DUF1015 family)
VPDFLPFRGTRYDEPPPADLSMVTAPPYDVIDEEERAALEASDPHNSVRLIQPRAGPGEDPYLGAARALTSWRDEGLLTTDDSPRFYGYRMSYDDDGVSRHTVGMIGALALDGGAHDVLPHERTMPKARSDRLALLRATRANLDPIWGLSLASGMSALVPRGPVVATADAGGTHHELVVIDDPEAIAAIRRAVSGAPVVLADGHHRFETARAYRDEQPQGSPGVGAIMALVVQLAEDELCVGAIHRLVHGLTPGSLTSRVTQAFETSDAGPNTPEAIEALVDRMRRSGALGIVDRDRLTLATPRGHVLEPRLRDLPEAVRGLDAARFEVGIRPSLGDATLTYRDDAGAVATLVAKGAADAAVLLRPVTVPEIRAAAFADVRMPEKTTFFHPKPRTGMVFRTLDDD